MTFWEQEAGLVTNLEHVAVCFVVTTLLAELECDPVLLKFTIHQTIVYRNHGTIIDAHVLLVVDAFTNLSGVVVGKLAPYTMFSRQLPNVASMELGIA